jgi:rubrerythrin
MVYRQYELGRGLEDCLMARQLTFRDVLEEAIKKELDSQMVYKGLEARVKNQSAREAFKLLAEEEAKHKRLLEDYLEGKLRDGTLSVVLEVDYKIAENLEPPEITASMELKDVFLLAANREKAAYDLYMWLSGLHPDGQLKQLFEDLATQELGHKKLVENLYTEVAFPQTGAG